VVAARDLPTGHRLEPADLGRAAVPTGIAVPGATADAQPLLGQVLAAPLVRGEAVTPARLMAPAGWSTGAGTARGTGTVPLPVRFPDADAVRLLATGQRVDVLAAHGSGEDPTGLGGTLPRAQVVARGATVLAVADPGAVDTGLLGGGSDLGSGAPLVVLALTEPQALAVAGAAAGGHLSFTLASGQRDAVGLPVQP
jgi:pilus assembly protein CpaB